MNNKKYKKIICYLLCSVLAWTSVVPVNASQAEPADNINEADIRARYPHASIIHVAPENYLQLAESLRQQGYSIANKLPADAAQPTDEVTPPPYTPAATNDCGDRNQPSAGDESIRVMVDFSSDMMRSGNNGNRDAAAVVFVIIGTVLIVVWALYVFKYIYDVAAGFTPCGKWTDISLVRSAISSDTQQHADFFGLRYMTGFRDGATEFGISAEIGQSDILLADAGLPEMKGTYWFLGPVLRWRLSRSNNPSYFQMNFMAGSTEFEAMGTIAQANLGLQFGIGDGFKLGFSWGALNINLENTQGIVSERDQYYYLYGVNMGYQF
ncbi:MAG: hypothetical protein HYZ31_12775 [Gammaproteobacteria bacterium]|nr:hypothetical protein [Gammaproteobacteria bacterium]